MHKVEENILTELDYITTDKSNFLLAISGGVDSIVLATVLIKNNFSIKLAHANFQLRGKESNEDEKFIKEFAKKNKIELFTKKFKIDRSENIQQKARELRYSWFQELSKEYNLDYIITGHQLNDSVETVLMNMIRGCGIEGLTGISLLNKNILRPMIHLTRDEIYDYAKKNKIEWREDSSNINRKYKRNSVRHDLIPMLEKFNPSFLQTFHRNIEIWNSNAKIYHQSIQRLKTELVHWDDMLEGFKISILELASRGISEHIMFDLVEEFDFNSSQATQMYHALHSQPGKIFISKSHRAVVDRMFIIIKPEISKSESILITKHHVKNGFSFDKFKVEVIDKVNTYQLKKNQCHFLDFQKVKFPITVRNWQNGDKMIPFGMKGLKKVSDILTDLKIDKLTKDEIQVIVDCNDEILGILGIRSSEKFKVVKESTQILSFIQA